MLALRSFARAVPRTAFRAAPIRASQRCIAISRPSILSRTTQCNAFSTSRLWRAPAGDADAELSAKLEYERQIEIDSKPDHAALPQELEDFLADSPWKVQDQPGTENIVMTRQFGNESIKVECSIADMNADREGDELDEDSALDDEPDFGSDPTSGGKRTINQSGSRGGKIDVAPEDSIAPADRDVDTDSGDVAAYPLNLSITIDKGAIGATNIIARSEDGSIEIEYVHFYPRAELVDPKTSEAVKEAQNVYGGPPFPYLDADLQAMYETYVQERGIDTQLSLFLLRYVDYKEQREYVQWLDNMKKFIDA